MATVNYKELKRLIKKAYRIQVSTDVTIPKPDDSGYMRYTLFPAVTKKEVLRWYDESLDTKKRVFKVTWENYQSCSRVLTIGFEFKPHCRDLLCVNCDKPLEMKEEFIFGNCRNIKCPRD